MSVIPAWQSYLSGVLSLAAAVWAAVWVVQLRRSVQLRYDDLVVLNAAIAVLAVVLSIVFGWLAGAGFGWWELTPW